MSAYLGVARKTIYRETSGSRDQRPFYVISIIDNFSLAILASDINQAQDLAPVPMVLYAAIEQHGCPQRLVTGNGSVFSTKQAMAIYEALDIQKK